MASVSPTSYIVGNWKLHHSLEETEAFFRHIVRAGVRFSSEVEVAIAPTALALSRSLELAGKLGISIAAQNSASFVSGAYTGEISPRHLYQAGCRYVILGHSERRQYFKEDDVTLSKKVKLALNEGLTPIFCVGETLEQRNRWQEVLRSQIYYGLQGVDLPARKHPLLIAYEPVWAIGTGRVAQPSQAQEVHLFLRNLLGEMFSREGFSIPLLYGGSLSPDNIRNLLSEPDIDGALIGGASLDPQKMLTMIEIAETLSAPPTQPHASSHHLVGASA